MDISTGVGREQLEHRHEEVMYLVRWWVTQAGRYTRVRTHYDTVQDFQQAVWVRMLKSLPPGKRVNASFSTVVVKSCTWELNWAVAGANTRQGRLTGRIRRAVELQEAASVTEDDAHSAYVQQEFVGLVVALLRILHHRERIMVVYHFGLLQQPVLSQADLARMFGCTRTLIGVILVRAIQHLRVSFATRRLESYVPTMPEF